MKKLRSVSAILTFVIMLITSFSCEEDTLMKEDGIGIKDTLQTIIPKDSIPLDSTVVVDSMSVSPIKDSALIEKIGVSYMFPNETGFLKTYIKGHPRLILTQDILNNLKEQAKTDPLLTKYVNQVIAEARTKLSTTVYTSKGSVTMYFLDYSWKVFDEVTTLSFAYLWTGERQFADKAKSILLAVSSYPDWNPSRYLDVAVMGTAVSLGFDWLYNYLDATSRTTIKNAIIRNILTPGKALIGSSSTYWVATDNNWNLICNSGMIVSSLAVAEWNKEYANTIIPAAIKALDKPMRKFAPSGSWFEGIMYIKTSLDMLSFSMASLGTALNNNYLGLSNYSGLSGASDFYVSCYNDNNNKALCFSDIFDNYSRIPATYVFYYGSLYGNDNLINNEKKFIQNRSAELFHVVWYKKTTSSTVQYKNKYFAGDPELMIFNENRYGANSIFMGVKGGLNGASHGHLDLGNFEFEALGVKWAKDLGLDDYNLPLLFENKVGGKRWTYYRNSSFSHNVPIINNKNQSVISSAKFIKYQTVSSTPYGIIDLTNAYQESVTKLQRGVKVLDNNRSILVQDEFSMKANTDCYLGMTTGATISIIDSKTAVLRQNGKELYAKILSGNAQFSVQSCAQPAPQNPNKGYSRLIAKKTTTSLNYSIVIQLSPVWNGYRTADATIVPLSQW